MKIAAFAMILLASSGVVDLTARYLCPVASSDTKRLSSP
jgi:hypothetical protein